MTSLKGNERHQAILDRLAAQGRIDVMELADALGVSAVTVRSDLLYLERRQLLRRIRGGAIATRPSRYEYPIEVTATLQGAQKRAIARAAAAHIRDGATVIMDTGSTVAALAEEIPRDIADLAVVTNALMVALELSRNPKTRVLVTGGTLKPNLHSLISPFGELILREINADVAFLSCAGVHVDRGFTNANWEEAEIKKAMMRASRKVIMLADHTKIGHVATARIASLDEVDLLITDDGVSSDRLRELRAADIEVEVV